MSVVAEGRGKFKKKSSEKIPRPNMIDRNDEKVEEDLFKGWKGKWSTWETVMTSTKNKNEDFENRKPNAGFRMKYECLKKLEMFNGKDKDDGIYEWRVSRPGLEKPEVVYVGKSESRDENSLLNRIRVYCNNGSHQAVDIDCQLRNGRDLQVRVLYEKDTRKSAKEMESRVLHKYDYKWNDIIPR